MSDEPQFTFRKPEGLLAHYTKAAVAFERIVPTRKLQMSPYRDMRDPAENKDLVPGTGAAGQPGHRPALARLLIGFEGRPRAGADQPPQQRRTEPGRAREDQRAAGQGDVDRDQKTEAWYNAVRVVKDIRDSMRVLSFTRDTGVATSTFGCSWARPRMWEQYADAHRGVCLVFDQGALEQQLKEKLQALLYLGDVRYTPGGIAESAARNIIDDRIFDPAQRARAVVEYIDKNHEDFFFLKSDDFATEYEYRAVLMSQGDDYAYFDYGDALVAVVLGERVPSWHFSGARETCERAGIALRLIDWSDGRPGVIPGDPIDR